MSEREVLSSGFNGFGQFDCGLTRRTTKFKPIAIDDRLPLNLNLLISCSWSYNAYAAGRNIVLKGYIGNQVNSTVFISADDDIKQIAACDRLCLVLLQNGKLFKIDPKFATNLQEISCTSTPNQRKRNIFGATKSAESKRIILIALGTNISAAVSETNAVFSIPSQIGQIPRHVKVQQLVCGFEHALILTSNGDIYSWGNGLRGQLGAESLQVVETPTLIEALAGIKITFIAAGGWHSAAISAFGDLYTWGFNSDGQLALRLFKSNGCKEPVVYHLPQLLELPVFCACIERSTSKSVCCTPLKVFAGARHTVLQMSCKSLLVAGWNKHGQLSLSDENKTEKCDSFVSTASQTKPSNDFRVICGPWSTTVISGCAKLNNS